MSNPKRCQAKMAALPKNIFTLHGLWPSYQSGRWIDKCNSGTQISIKGDTTDLFEMMKIFWPSYTKGNDEFWSHEYNTHGFCYTDKYNLQDFRPYFEFSMNLFNTHQLDQTLLRTFGDISGIHEFDVNDLKNKIGLVLGDLKFELDCKRFNSKQYLQEIRFFFDLKLNPIPLRYSSDCKMDEPILIEFQ